MIRRFTHKAAKSSLLLLFCLASVSMVWAQNQIAMEDFSGGMGDWTSADVSGGNAAWTWCDDPAQAIGAGCVFNWGTYSNQHSGLYLSSTASNGFMVMDSDALTQLPTNHIAQLTSPAYDFSTADEVWIKLESLLGVFANPTLGFVFLRVSTDGVNWTDFDLYDIAPGNTGNEPGSIRWTDNPGLALVDISSVAANQGTVYIQFSWEGNWEYYWLLDDIEFFDSDPSLLFFPAHDISINPFFSIAPTAQIPEGQGSPISFLADVENFGLLDASGVELTVTINDGASDVFTETLVYGDIAVDSLAENVPFTGTFTPDGPAGTVYTGTYSISMDSTELAEELDNNERSFNFVITDSTFAMELGPNSSVAPAASNWDAGEPHSWAFANVFYTPNGDGKYARYMSFGINNAAEVLGNIVFVKLYKWDNANNTIDAEVEERTVLAHVIYEITGNEVANELITVRLTDLAGTPADIPLEDDGQYIASIEFPSPNDQVTLTMASSSDFNYTAQIFQDTAFNEAIPLVTSMLIVNDPIDTETYGSGGFGTQLDNVPAIRLSIGDSPVANKDLYDEFEVSITPNPATDHIQLNVDLQELAKDVRVNIVNVSGKVYKTIQLGDVDQISRTIPVSDLPAGSYYMHLSNDTASATRRFVVIK